MAKTKEQLAKEKADKAKKDKAAKGKTPSSALSKEELALNAKVKEQRAADDAAATTRADKYYSPGSLPRLAAPEKIASVGPASKVRDIGRESAPINASIAQSQQHYEESKIRDAYVTDALTRMQEGLAGFNTPELQAMREKGRREVQAQGKNTERALRQMAGSTGLTGQALASELRRTKRAVQQDVAGQEVDLTIAQAGEQRTRLGAYGTYANQAYESQQAAKDAALGRLNTQQTAAGDYALSADKANQGADATNASNEMDVNKTNADIQGKNIANTTANDAANALQAEKEKSGYVGMVTGDAAVTEAYRNSLVQKGLSKESIDAAKGGINGTQETKKKTTTTTKKRR